jgi:hypothetical protein
MKAAGAFNDRPRELHHNMQQTYCENRNGATLRNVISAPRTPSTPWSKRGCLGWVGFSPSPGPFLYWIGLKNWGHRHGKRQNRKTTLPSTIAAVRGSLAYDEVFPDAAPRTSFWLPYDAAFLLGKACRTLSAHF